MLENRMLQDYFDYNFDTDEYDKRMNALAEKTDEEYENNLKEEF